MKRPIIIDTDPGVDDAVAILLALASPELEVLGLTAVAGNVPLATAAGNARRIGELARRPDLGVFAGCPRPMVRSAATAEPVHGADGLGGVVLPGPMVQLRPKHAVDWIVDTLMAAEDEITLCALGPLTNLAVALVKEPRIQPRIGEIVVMGGAFAGGNSTPVAEFNIHTDPHAAHVVFRAGCKLTLIPLDLTYQAIATPARLARIGAIGTPVAAFVAAILASYGRAFGPYGMEGGAMHDPCVIAYLLQPDLLSGRTVNVEIEIGSQTALGMTIMDRWGVTGRAANCTVMHAIDADGFFDLLCERLARL